MGGVWNIIVFHGSVVLYKMVSFSNSFKLAIFAQSGVQFSNCVRTRELYSKHLDTLFLRKESSF